MNIRFGFGGALAMALLAVSAAPGDAAAREQVRPVPIGETLRGQVGDREYGVFIPTRHGGNLTVTTSGGKVESITGPDGRARTNGAEVGGADSHGWYTFRVSAPESGAAYDVSVAFVQVGEATRKPWNYYYWPTKGDSIHEPWAGGNGRVDTPGPAGDDVMLVPQGSAIAPGQDIILPGANGLLETRPAPGDTSTWFPNLFDDLTCVTADGGLHETPAPLLKYDQLLGLSARSWEAAYTQTHGMQRWPGHCLGGAVASIMLNEPTPAPGTGMTRDELKALWSELGENHLNHRIGDNANNMPAGPPRPGFDACDAFVPRFHAVLERNIRAKKIALLANLRAFPPGGGPDEVWNHGIGKYTATFHAVPGAGERRVRIKLEIEANTGSNLNEQDPKPRINRYEYMLVYGMNGEVDEGAIAGCDWISVGGDAMYAPLNLMEVAESHWQGHNPMVNEANVRSLDAANGGGQRFTGSPPTFRPAGTYESGRAPMTAASPVMYGSQGLPGTVVAPSSGSAPRRSFLRVFGRE